MRVFTFTVTKTLRAHTHRWKKGFLAIKTTLTMRVGTIIFKSCTSGGGLDELPSDDMLAPSRPVVNPSISHSDVSESLSRDVVLGGDR